MRIGEVLTIDEYIKREYAVDAVLDIYCNTSDIDLSCEKFEAVILEIPTADVEQVRHGRWISASNKPGVNIGMKCSVCSARIKNSEFFNGNHNYCHKCGAKMDGDEE